MKHVKPVFRAHSTQKARSPSLPSDLPYSFPSHAGSTTLPPPSDFQAHSLDLAIDFQPILSTPDFILEVPFTTALSLLPPLRPTLHFLQLNSRTSGFVPDATGPCLSCV